MNALKLPHPIAWPDKLLVKSLHNHIKNFSESNKLKTKANFRKILSQNIEFISDEPSQSHTVACALVLATYEQLLENGIAEKVAVEQLTYAFLQPGRKIVTWIMRVSLWLSRNPQKMIVNETRRKLKLYGKTFEFDEELGINHFASIVKKCGYHGFFVRNFRPELTSIFCEWDRLWIDEIERQNNGVYFTRPFTIGQGGSCCRFEFTFDENPK